MSETNRPELPDLFDFICFAVYSANHAFGRTYKPLLDQLGLTYPQYLVMVVLWAEDGQTVGAIGQKLFLESNTLTPLLKRLEALGYVTRTRATHDERQVLIHLTDKGHELNSKAETVPKCIGEALGMDLTEAGRLRDELFALRDRLLPSAG